MTEYTRSAFVRLDGIGRMMELKFLQCPSRDLTACVVLVLLAPILLLLLLANPGFFSHDELQKVDHIQMFGFLDYLRLYTHFHDAISLSFPVRPVSFLWQGLVSFFVPGYNFVVHLADVWMHAAICVLLFLAIKRVHGDRQFAWITALIFLASPLVVFSVGWPAALMDRLYVLFGLIALIFADNYISKSGGWGSLIVIVLASTLAVLSKETAVILPVLPLFYFISAGASRSTRRIFLASLVWALPIAVFMIYRLIALMHYTAPAGSNPYAVSLQNIPDGILVYFAYPFLYQLLEAGNWVLLGRGEFVAATVLHLILLLLLWRTVGIRWCFAYLAGYFLFVLPVLPIQTKGAHYLYGSGAILSLGLAALFTLGRTDDHGHYVVRAGGLLLLMLTVVHSFMGQRFIYDLGVCVDSATKTLESAYLATGKPREMHVSVEAGAQGHVLHRIATGRSRLGNYGPVSVKITDATAPDDNGAAYRFNRECLVYPSR